MKIPLSTMWMADSVDEGGKGDHRATRSLVLGWPTVNVKARFSSKEQKDQWHSFLQRYINLAKEKDHSKSILLKIFTKDIKNCAYSTTITAINSDTTNDIINRSLRMLRITGSEKDYQMWVSFGKKEAPYPLIGHENPYEVKMRHRQATELLPQRPRDSVSPSTSQGPYLLDHHFSSPELQVQFILKPRHPAKSQQAKAQKTVKRRPSTINWAFWQSSGSPQDNFSKSPSTSKPRGLFGASLTDICENDKLPTSLLDMLFYINKEGPLTEGIFRMSANVKSCRALKEKLCSGVKVDWDSESIFVLVSVLKDFLRNIEGSIFSSDLYDKWLDVIVHGNEEEKITAIQRLLDQLPRANVVLLEYIFCILYNIEQHCSSNKMTAYNLSVCVAPSLLWPPTSCILELENEKEVSLIQFIIKNCLRIFGEHITSLLEEGSMTRDNRENTSVIPMAPQESNALSRNLEKKPATLRIKDLCESTFPSDSEPASYVQGGENVVTL